MLFGAAAASWLAGSYSLPQVIHPAVALLGAALLGGLWGLVPALLKHFIGVNEIIATLLLNPIASVLVGLVRLPAWMSIALVAFDREHQTFGWDFCCTHSCSTYLHISLAHTTRLGSAHQRQCSPFCALRRDAHTQTSLLAMVLSGALAGLAGGVEVLGVQYHFVSNFSAVNDFDGLIIAFPGHLHPAGVVLFAFLLGGLRTDHRGIADPLWHPTANWAAR